MDIQRPTEVAISAAKKLQVDDAVALAVYVRESMVRFANNSVTVANRIDETELMVYLVKDKRRAIANTSNLQDSNVTRFVKELFVSLKGLPAEDFQPLPTKGAKYGVTSAGYDRKIEAAGEEIPGLAEEAISASLKAGGKRSAGVVTASDVSYSILASNGTKGTDERSSITLNIRSFSEGDASGHGLSCSSTMAGFDPGEAGRMAGEDAKKMRSAKEPEAGKYEVLFSPTVAANLIETVVNSSSAFSVDAGTSFLVDKLGKKVAADCLSITDHGKLRGGLGGRAFDDEGMPTRSTPVIQGGVLKGYLHNLTTARKWKTPTTGNAGIVSPHPWNVEVSAGDSTYDEMVKGIKRGVVLTSNWYTRFKNYRTGEFSTVPRDGAYLVENGKITKSLKGMRVSDELERLFTSVSALSKNRDWIEWWEVDTPTLCPWVLASGVSITRAYE
jgi:PmbA protein